jgi:ubiquinol oxidase
MAETPREPMNTDTQITVELHHPVRTLSDRVAYGTTRVLRFFADTLFAKRYGNRAIVLETVAAVPGMVGGALLHLRCLRWMRDDQGWIRTLLDEAENERMHLMTFMEIARPNWFERMMVLVAQALFLTFYLLLYLVSSRTAHRLVGYFEEEAVVSYTRYLEEIDAGRIENVPAPSIAIEYWKLPHDARLRDVVIAVREDEAGHRDVNHAIAGQQGHPVPATDAL